MCFPPLATVQIEQNLWAKFQASDLHRQMLARLEARSHWKQAMSYGRNSSD